MATTTKTTPRKRAPRKQAAPKQAEQAAAAEQAEEDKTPEPRPLCRCGCGQTPKSTRGSFLPGHDAALRGVVLRAIRAQAPDARPGSDAASAAERAARGLGPQPGRKPTAAEQAAWAWAIAWLATSHPDALAAEDMTADQAAAL